MQIEPALALIEEVASKNHYCFEKSDSNFWEVYIDRSHGVAYGLNFNSTGYIEVRNWEGEQYGEGQYGRAIYSLRDMNDVAIFCNLLISGYELRAKR
ncbi:hypothetical protein [Vibrio fluvialis]|uniref:hypothetical protein n=1 Tax=Vibrio fluvialis TaxID=676 RepID=UPI001F265320|nr:hypothetical protein [Vibrio fluvialis]MCE7600096.1 hypothetical protein [Vibrio fluvialis]